MTLVKYNPFTPAKPFNVDTFLDDFFGRSVSDFLGTEITSSTPSVNILENEDNYKIEVAAPGLTKADFSIELIDDQLIVSTQKKESAEDNEATADINYKRREFSYSSFKRSFHVSDEIEKDTIDAKYTDGILSIILNKKEEAKPKPPTSIKIK